MSYLMKLATIASDQVPNIKPEWILSQWAHETGGFQSELCVEHNNFAGLTQDTPNGLEQPDGSCYYMEFDSAIEFATYFGKYLRLYESDGIFNCQSLEDYIRVLKDGGYFGASYDEYLTGVRSWLVIIQ